MRDIYQSLNNIYTAGSMTQWGNTERQLDQLSCRRQGAPLSKSWFADRKDSVVPACRKSLDTNSVDDPVSPARPAQRAAS